MRTIDLHCDVLYKLANSEEPLSFLNSPQLDVTLEKLKAIQAKAQVFALFVSEEVPQSLKFLEVLRQIEKFQCDVIAPYEEMVHITKWEQLEHLKEHEIGAILSLEGCDVIGDDLMKLQSLIDSGVLLVGLTWNHENAVAYGADEDSSLHVKPFGYEVIERCNEHGIIVDVSHLNERGFWDVMERANHVIASHSNAWELCKHPRNLKDDQLKAIAEKGGRVHVVYYPLFVQNEQKSGVQIDDLVAHVRYITNIIGTHKVGLGSDFDGIEFKIENLEGVQHVPNLLERLQEHYTEEEMRGITSENFSSYIAQIGAK